MRIILNLLLQVLSLQQLFPLLNQHILLLIDHFIFRFSLNRVLLLLQLNRFLHKFKCLRLIVSGDVRCFSDNSAFKRCGLLLLINHRWWTIRLRQNIFQRRFCTIRVKLLFKMLNHLRCFFPICFLIRVGLSVYLSFSLWSSSRGSLLPRVQRLIYFRCLSFTS